MALIFFFLICFCIYVLVKVVQRKRAEHNKIDINIGKVEENSQRIALHMESKFTEATKERLVGSYSEADSLLSQSSHNPINMIILNNIPIFNNTNTSETSERSKDYDIHLNSSQAKRDNSAVQVTPCTLDQKIKNIIILNNMVLMDDSNITELVELQLVEQNKSITLDNDEGVQKKFFDDQKVLNEGLISFTISSTFAADQTINKTKGRWIKQGEYIKFKNYETRQGFFYYGGQLDAYHSNQYVSRYFTEASLIDDTLEIVENHSYFIDASIDYQPRYIQLSAEARGAYLDWLFGARRDPNTPIGYVFIYFYGLERRILVDSTQGDVDNHEYIAIFDEIKCLYSIFDSHYIFKSYALKLMELMVFLRPNMIGIDYSEFYASRNSILFKYHLATEVEAGKTVSADLALGWISNTDDYNLRTPAKRCWQEFSILFKHIYLQETKGGLFVKPNKSKLNINYYPASSTIQGFKLDPVDLPDPSILKAPIKRLAMIADQCTAELEQYSRYLGKQENDKEDLAAFLLLPEILQKMQPIALINDFNEWAKQIIQNNEGLVLFSELWSFTKKPLPEKLNKKELELLESLLGLGNYVYTPNINIHHIKPSIDGYVVISNKGLSHKDYLSSSFSKICLFIRFALMLAQSDQHVHESEKMMIYHIIDREDITEQEKSSLKQLLLWGIHTPLNMVGLTQQTTALDEISTAFFRQTLPKIILADGQIDIVEIKQLEKIYTLLGIDKSYVSSDLHQNSTQDIFEEKSIKPQQLDGAFSLDLSILKQHEAATKEVQSLLETIFIEEEIFEEKPQSVMQEKIKKISLDPAHYELFEILIKQQIWQRAEVEIFCQKWNLMFDGALETINDWAYDIVEAPIIEEAADDIYIDLEIVTELQGVLNED